MAALEESLNTWVGILGAQNGTEALWVWCFRKDGHGDCCDFFVAFVRARHALGFFLIALAIYLQKVDDQKKRIKELEEMLEKQQQEENPDQSQWPVRVSEKD